MTTRCGRRTGHHRVRTGRGGTGAGAGRRGVAHRAIDPTSAALAGLLGSRFTVVPYDRRGRGGSGDTKPFAKEREIEDLGRDRRGRRRGVRARWFVGAMLVLDAAAAGLPIPRLAVYEPPIIVDDSRPPLPADYVEHLTELTAPAETGTPPRTSSRRRWGCPEQAVDGMRQGPFWASSRRCADDRVRRGVRRGTMSGAAARPGPVGRRDPAGAGDRRRGERDLHAHGGRRARGGAPDPERRTLEGQTHDVAADVLSPVLAGFFADPAARNAPPA